MRFKIPRVRTLCGLALAGVLALALGGSALADIEFGFSPPFSGTKRYYDSITAKHSGLRLSVPAASTVNGTQIVQWDGTTPMHSMWELLNPPGVSGRFSIRNRWSRQCLDVDSRTEGAPVVQRPCDGTVSQQWRYNTQEEAGDQYYRNITNYWSGLDMNIANASGALGGKLVQYHRVKGAPNALFNIQTQLTLVD